MTINPETTAYTMAQATDAQRAENAGHTPQDKMYETLSLTPPLSITATQIISPTPVQPKVNSKTKALTELRTCMEKVDRHLKTKPTALICQPVISQGKMQQPSASLQR